MVIKKVMDISSWNTVSNYDAVADDVDGVILRSGYRGYGSAGNLVMDTKYMKNAVELYKRGVPVGIYFFTTAITEAEARAEADYAVSLIKKAGIEISFPIFVDTEWSNNEHNGRSDKLSKSQRTKCVVAFCERIIELGYIPGIYASDSWFTSQLIPGELKKYKVWNARYSTTKPYLYTTNMVGWQHTSSGSVNGMTARVDLSEWYDDIKIIKQGSVTVSKPATTPTESTTVTETKSNTYVVKSGDTLSKIGKALGFDWKEIAELNGIKAPYRINVNQVLKLPVKVEETVEETVVSEDTYVVQSGDTLSKIGSKLKLNWKDIAALNGIKSPYRIITGQVLRLRVNTEEPKDEVKEETPTATTTEDTYTVVAGDSLTKIGKTLKMDWKEIAAVNGIKAPYRINIGQVLKLPVVVETPEADDESEIAPIIKPVSYMQTDPKWKALPYAVDGESSTIGSAGCGPTAMAMVLASLVSPYIDPVTTCSWARMKGYKAKNAGTFYSYLVPQAEAYGIKCRRLNSASAYHNKTNSAHAEALAELKKGNWVVACMGVGNWTKGGHFVLAYGYKDGMVYINDSASTRADRLCNTWDVFSNEVKYYWVIEVPEAIKKAGKIVTTGEYKHEDFVREVQYCCGAGLDGKEGNQTLSKTVTVSKTINNKHHVVLPLQKKLKLLKYYTGELDCSAGPLFDTATKNMQGKELKYAKKNQDGEFTAKGKSWQFVLGLIKKA